jgi:hypothetical protein
MVYSATVKGLVVIVAKQQTVVNALGGAKEKSSWC